MASLPKLRRLAFGNRTVTAAELLAIQKFKTLKTLDLAGSIVDSDALLGLVNPESEELRFVCLRNSTVDTKSLIEVGRQMPTIYWDLVDTNIEPRALNMLQQHRAYELRPMRGMQPIYETLPLYSSVENPVAELGDVDPRMFAPKSIKPTVQGRPLLNQRLE